MPPKPRKPKGANEALAIGTVMGALMTGVAYGKSQPGGMDFITNIVPVVDDDGDYQNQIRVLTAGGDLIYVTVDRVENLDAVEDLQNMLTDLKK